VTASNGDQPIFKSVQQSQATALQSRHAEEEAAASALRKVVEDYDAATRTEGN
jgi:hypothetical protein